MEFIETPTFTALIAELLHDDEYSNLQRALLRDVEAEDLIPGGGGLRKVRWARQGRSKGKRGGIRVIYYAWILDRVYMLFAYDKYRQDDLTPEQIKHLHRYVKERIL